MVAVVSGNIGIDGRDHEVRFQGRLRWTPSRKQTRRFFKSHVGPGAQPRKFPDTVSKN